MHDCDRVIDDSHERQHVEGIVDVLEDPISEDSFHDSPARFVKTIGATTGHVFILLTELMVATNKEHSSWVQDLQCEQEDDSFNLMWSTINPIAIENIRAQLNITTTMTWESVPARGEVT
jgi:hypothetical protein